MAVEACACAVAFEFVDEVEALGVVEARVGVAFVYVGGAGRAGVARQALAVVAVDEVDAFAVVLTWVGVAFVYVYLAVDALDWKKSCLIY